MTYSYTGNPYDYFLSADESPGEYWEAFQDGPNPFFSTTPGAVTAEFAIDRRLLPGSLAEYSYSSDTFRSPGCEKITICAGDAMTYFRFSDGVNSLMIDSNHGVHSYLVFSFETDQAGDRVDCSVVIGDDPDHFHFTFAGDCGLDIIARSATAPFPCAALRETSHNGVPLDGAPS